jgi:DtxR family Mn-dependent transcriptional regulator
VAINIIRKHRLWEYFLVEKLNFKWDEVHDMAEEMEHISSNELIDRLDEFMGFPKRDPHGDPIPDCNGHFKTNDLKPISPCLLVPGALYRALGTTHRLFTIPGETGAYIGKKIM